MPEYMNGCYQAHGNTKVNMPFQGRGNKWPIKLVANLDGQQQTQHHTTKEYSQKGVVPNFTVKVFGEYAQVNQQAAHNVNYANTHANQQ
jgi:hypothetical protein